MREQNLLTPDQIKEAAAAKQKLTLKDGGSLTLELDGTGRGKWLYKGRVPGQRQLIWLTCGYWPEVELRDARIKRDEYRATLKQGINPNAQRREQREQERRAKIEREMTFEKTALEYLERRKDITEATQKHLLSLLHNYCQRIASKSILAIERAKDLKPLIERVTRDVSPVRARKVATFITAVFSFALDSGYIQATPAERLTRFIPKSKDTAVVHRAAITTAEGASFLFQKIWSSQRNNSIFVKTALKVMAYLPLRVGNVVKARWQDIDMQGSVWTFPCTKNGRQYALPIPRQVKELLLELPQGNPDDFVFQGHLGKGKHLSNVTLLLALREILADQKHLHTLHGFRSLFTSLCQEMGLPSMLIERSLFHTDRGTTHQVYRRGSMLTPLAAMLSFWADTVDVLREGQPLPTPPQDLRELFK